MELRPLGSTGIRVSPLGLGTVKLGRSEGVKYPTAVTIPDDGQARALLDTAQRHGINLIDTAPAYGTSEERLGVLLHGQRERWVIVTKVGEEFERGVSRFDFSPAAVRASVERSLERLRTDRVEVVLVHSDGVIEQDLEFGGLMDELRSLKARGLVRAIGASTKSVVGGLHAAERCDVVMLTLNAAEQQDVPAIALAHRRGVGVLIKKALSSGHFRGTSGGDPVRESLKLALGTPGVSSVIVGTANAEHLAENCAIAGSVLSSLPLSPPGPGPG